MKLLILSSLMSLGCSNQFSPKVYQNPELIPLVNVVLNEGIKRGKFYLTQDISINYSDLSGTTVGVCIRTVDSKTILIDKKFWIYNINTREQVIAHELGHCMLNLRHNDSYTRNYPASLMNSYIFNSVIFISNRDYYYNQFFGN